MSQCCRLSLKFLIKCVVFNVKSGKFQVNRQNKCKWHTERVCVFACLCAYTWQQHTALSDFFQNPTGGSLATLQPLFVTKTAAAILKVTNKTKFPFIAFTNQSQRGSRRSVIFASAYNVHIHFRSVQLSSFSLILQPCVLTSVRKKSVRLPYRTHRENPCTLVRRQQYAVWLLL